MCDVGIAQIPGAMRERMVRARLGAQAGSQAEAEIRMALNRVGGVRSVVAERGEGVFRVACSAPDEMLTSSLSVLKFVKNVSVEAVSNIAEID